MTGGELINLLYEEIEINGMTDAEIIRSDVDELLEEIHIPAKHHIDCPAHRGWISETEH